MAEEITHLGDVAIEDQLALALEGVAYGVGPDVGVAVHVAAHPGPKAHNRAREVVGGVHGVSRAQRRRHGVVEGGNDFVDDVGEIEENVLDLVAHAPPYPRVLRGLPHESDLVPEAPGQCLFLGAGHTGVIEAVDQDARHPLLLGEDGAPNGLGGVGSEDRFHEHVTEEFTNASDREAAGREAEDDVLEAARLRGARAQIGAPPADAVDPLSHVHEREVGGEGASDLGRLPGLETGQQVVQPAVRFLVTVAPGPGGDPRRLHSVKKRVAPLLAQHVAEQGAKKADVPAEGVTVAAEDIEVRVHRHGPSSHHESRRTATLRGLTGNPRPRHDAPGAFSPHRPKERLRAR